MSALGAPVRRSWRVGRGGASTASAPDVFEEGGGNVIAIITGDSGPEMTAVSVVDAAETVLVNAGALFKALNVLRDEVERVACVEELGFCDELRENGYEQVWRWKLWGLRDVGGIGQALGTVWRRERRQGPLRVEAGVVSIC